VIVAYTRLIEHSVLASRAGGRALPSLEHDRRMDGPSVARALDEARARINEAWDRDERPAYLLCNDELYAAVAEAKQREIDAGRPLRLLGLLVVREPRLAAGEIDVR
jgi:hypothetical protein